MHTLFSSPVHAYRVSKLLTVSVLTTSAFWVLAYALNVSDPAKTSENMRPDHLLREEFKLDFMFLSFLSFRDWSNR